GPRRAPEATGQAGWRGSSWRRPAAMLIILKGRAAPRARIRHPQQGGPMAGKRLTVEELWKMQRPAQPTLSPDGAQPCVSVTAYDMKENNGRASLWLLSAFGGEPRRLTTMGDKDGEPRWSPDGRWIAFVAKRSGAGQDADDQESQ